MLFLLVLVAAPISILDQYSILNDLMEISWSRKKSRVQYDFVLPCSVDFYPQPSIGGLGALVSPLILPPSNKTHVETKYIHKTCVSRAILMATTQRTMALKHTLGFQIPSEVVF